MLGNHLQKQITRKDIFFHMTNSLPSTVYIKWIKSTHDPEDDFLMASEHPSAGAELYTLTPERNDMNEKLHYTDEEKIKRLSAWHEADKITIAARDAEIVRLKGIVKMAYTTMRAVRDEIPEPAYHAIIILLGSQWAATWDAVQKESQS
jgi:hypothetical protein